ncbi:MAG: N-6 DNA methylase [Sedimentisphaerales bacterium]|nr:N-6 DNA methylase [Sedimentisphaerales bacterium]
MKATDKIRRLVEIFENNIEAYRSGHYNETQLRREFLDPFFIELGWDVNNTSGYAEAYKDVIHEDSIKIGSAIKAPDYCFRIGGMRKFFVEAKKPSINIKNEPAPAFQLRRYAWSAKLPLSILTDFEEFAIYDCRIQPKKTDRASTARTIYITYREYTDRWEEIAEIFSKDAILKGSFDKYAVSAKKKKGTAEVDTAFLSDIEVWREILAKNIALRNQTLSNRELNYAVQRTIDRIIFLRICEDRGIEYYGQLQSLLNGTKTYERLLTIYDRADERYNSGLFHFMPEKDRKEPPDELTHKLTIDDKILKEILKKLYYPDSPYEFSVLPSDILGQVYEQFLGKVITLSKGHRAKVEEKPEVKKAGGVYYTPTYIVDYIVENTVGKLLENKNPTTAAKLKILDPACGSGSFLIGAYQYLLDWHLKYYTQNDPEGWARKRQARIYQDKKDEWKLTTAERKRILLNNIYGVDIDNQAVEVTKLSLLLKVLEKETQASLDNQLKLFHERALPDLSNNIKCGNSLIGPDFYEGKQLGLFDEEEMYRINAFDWQAEFPGIFKSKNSGFNAVIGNPPYGADFPNDTPEYLKNNYVTYVWRGESYLIFIEKATKLLKNSGFFGYIIPDTYLNLGFTLSLRQFILQHTKILEIVSLPSKVFGSATVDTTILFTERTITTNEYNESRVKVNEIVLKGFMSVKISIL